MVNDVNQTTLIVEDKGNTFTFQIPSLRDEAKISTHVQSLILQDSPDSAVKEGQLDDNAQLLYRTIATFNVLLKSSSAKWAYVESPLTKGPIINPNLPADAVTVYVKYLGELSKFFQDGATAGDAPSQSAMDSKPNS